MKRPGATHYAPISWDAAFGLVADHLNALDTPDEAIFYTYGRASNEAAFAYQLFIRAYGTNNLPDCSNMCHESTSVALAETIGIGKASVSLEESLEYCAEDECLEVTPKDVRIRKVVLSQNDRAKVRSRAKAAAQAAAKNA